ncbi:MAG TPA: SDR family oxidoreductase [Candidatus Thermoplasmatota archaeon]|nr:SDR family oxidoreductase [Candidatus Thermoplasmatota archaeon]
MPPPLAGRHALVCGASAGIGRAAAIALASKGATITLLSRKPGPLQDLRPILMNAGASETHAIVADLADVAGTAEKVKAHLKKAGPIHILVNNAGGPPSGPLLNATEKEILDAFGPHLLVSHRLVQLLLPGMKEAGYGRIVNILSVGAKEPIPGLGVSGIVRSAMASWAKTLSRELPPGVTINSVLPGYTDTERLQELAVATAKRQGKKPDEIRAGWIANTPEGRLGRPEEIGEAIAFLASPEASFIRGVQLAVDGGRLLSL